MAATLPVVAEDDAIAVLREATPFGEASPVVLSRIAALARSARYAAGERIYTAGDAADEIFIVASGRADHVFKPEVGAREPLKRVTRGRGGLCVQGGGGRGGAAEARHARRRVRLGRAASRADAAPRYRHRRRADRGAAHRYRSAGRAPRIAAPGRRPGHGALCRHDSPRVRRAGAARPGAPPVGPAHRGDVEPQPDDVSPVAVAEEPAALPDADRLRALSRHLVSRGRSVEAAALSRDAGSHDGGEGVVLAVADLRPFALYRGVLQAHRGVGVARDAGVLPRYRARRHLRPAPRLVAALPRIRLPGVRDAAADPDPRLGAARHRHVHRHRVGG